MEGKPAEVGLWVIIRGSSREEVFMRVGGGDGCRERVFPHSSPFRRPFLAKKKKKKMTGATVPACHCHRHLHAYLPASTYIQASYSNKKKRTQKQPPPPPLPSRSLRAPPAQRRFRGKHSASLVWCAHPPACRVRTAPTRAAPEPSRMEELAATTLPQIIATRATQLSPSSWTSSLLLLSS